MVEVIKPVSLISLLLTLTRPTADGAPAPTSFFRGLVLGGGAGGRPEQSKTLSSLDRLDRRIARRREEQTVPRAADAADLLAAQEAVETVRVDPSVGRYCVALAAATRGHRAVHLGASPRGSLALVLLARALAVIRGRDYITPEDVKAVAVPALAHRISIRPELWMTSVTGADVVREVLSGTPVPGARP